MSPWDYFRRCAASVVLPRLVGATFQKLIAAMSKVVFTSPKALRTYDSSGTKLIEDLKTKNENWPSEYLFGRKDAPCLESSQPCPSIQRDSISSDIVDVSGGLFQKQSLNDEVSSPSKVDESDRSMYYGLVNHRAMVRMAADQLRIERERCVSDELDAFVLDKKTHMNEVEHRLRDTQKASLEDAEQRLKAYCQWMNHRSAESKVEELRANLDATRRQQASTLNSITVVKVSFERCAEIESRLRAVAESKLNELDEEKRSLHHNTDNQGSDSIPELSEDLQAGFDNISALKLSYTEMKTIGNIENWIMKAVSCLGNIQQLKSKMKKVEEAKLLLVNKETPKLEPAFKLTVPDTKSAAQVVPKIVHRGPRHNLECCLQEEAASQELLRQHLSLSKAFCDSQEPSMKALRSNLTRYICTQINGVDASSPGHLTERIMSLLKLVQGQSVACEGAPTINISSNPIAMAFAENLIAKIMVSHAEKNICSHYPSAFAYASVLFALWSSSAQLGQLLMAHLYQRCPFLVPVHHYPDDKAVSPEESLRRIGYLIDKDGSVEAEDYFLRRMSGLVRLYAAIVQTELPSKMTSGVHPHGLDHGWRFIARTLNVTPFGASSAWVLLHFLEVAGHSMAARFKVQFWKLMKVCQQAYMPMLDATVSGEGKMPFARLESFLNSSLGENKVPLPEGHLPLAWWRSS